MYLCTYIHTTLMAGNVLLDGVLLSAHLEVHVHEPERGANGAPTLYYRYSISIVYLPHTQPLIFDHTPGVMNNCGIPDSCAYCQN